MSLIMASVFYLYKFETYHCYFDDLYTGVHTISLIHPYLHIPSKAPGEYALLSERLVMDPCLCLVQ